MTRAHSCGATRTIRRGEERMVFDNNPTVIGIVSFNRVQSCGYVFGVTMVKCNEKLKRSPHHQVLITACFYIKLHELRQATIRLS